MNRGWAITGTGMMTSVGADKTACFAAFCAGQSGNKPLQAFRHECFHAQHAYEIADRPENKDYTDRATSWVRRAITEAVTEAGIDNLPERTAVVLGTGLRELRSLELWWVDGQPFRVDKLHFSSAVQHEIGVDAPVMNLSNACAASSFALGLAADMLELGEAEVAIVVGCDSITESMFGLLDRVNPLHPERLQPYDRNRRGVLMGEGAAALVLETPEHAAARQAKVKAWLRSVGMSCDAYHVTAPERHGIARAMRDAHQRAGVGPEHIDLLMVHGTGTILNDSTEASAITDVFGDHVAKMTMTGLKSLTGHTSGASGLVGTITAVECMNQGRIPPTLGLTEPMPEAEQFHFVLDEAKIAHPQIAQVNAFGFGGVNAVAILEKAA